jgi:hypothetical protein
MWKRGNVEAGKWGYAEMGLHGDEDTGRWGLRGDGGVSCLVLKLVYARRHPRGTGLTCNPEIHYLVLK